MGNRSANHECANKPRACCIGNAFYVLLGHAYIRKYLITQGQQLSYMVSGSQFWHHSTVIRMHLNLAEQCVCQQTAITVVQCHTGFIAGCFNTKDQHKFRATLIRVRSETGILAETTRRLSDSSEQTLTLLPHRGYHCRP